MLKENLFRIFLIGFLMASMVVVISIGKASPEPVIHVEPRVSTVAPGQIFTVNITIVDVTLENSINGLYGWEFHMSFNASILQAVSVEEGPFLKSAGTTFWTQPKIDNVTGIVSAVDFFFPYPAKGALGSGVLADITFQVISEGETSLHFLYEALYLTKLRTYDGTNILPIEHTSVDGTFKYPLLRDVAVKEVVAFPTSVLAGELVSINVTVKNEGDAMETFDVTILYDSTTIETKKVTDLAQGNLQTLSFSWNTKDVAEGNYTITATASTLSGETDIEDNTHTNGAVRVKAPPSTFPTELLAAIIVIVVVTVGILLYLRRRKPTKT